MSSSLEINSVQIAAVAILFTAGGALWALFRLVTTTAESLRKEMLSEIDKAEAILSKARHDLANQVQIQIARQESEIDRLKRETVRREDMAAIETRLTNMFSKIESKVDSITDRLAGFAALEKQMMSMDNRLENAMRQMVGKGAGN